ncbi:M23 family metallopeptidase [Nonlabens ponticola]|uniref:M23 family peptidase n=1 Tax=Nonlabens ponticola TaxID=2496866 RepID=A0A3S9MWZ7_9FLAO|nr:M23 family metallopeptidase [Nonlabens ponticola]AZQ43776.1 M23 family peptidase [Nonlabens ponticola]
MQSRYFLFVFLAFFMLRFGESQTIQNLPQDYFQHPLDIELKLSGTFGELRSNHFHSGLDIKTNQRTGAKVYAAASGYVSRIKIEHYGYGKALYITHPNGYTTVYAHLKNFSPRIEEYLKKKQYAAESYTIQLYPDDLDLRVDKGEVVAYSGNTGGSGGPHLHFEIRDSSARPMNPFMFGIDVADSRRPLVKQVKAYPLSDDATINGKHESKLLRVIPLKDGKFKTEKFSAYGKIGIGVNTNDRLDAANNQNGIYHVNTYFNGKKNFEMTFDKYTFAETRYINQMIDYEHFKNSKSRISKFYVPDGSPLSLYGKTIDNGKLTLVDPGTTHQFKAEIQDFKGNESVLLLDIYNEEATEIEMVDAGDATYVPAQQTFTKTLGAFDLTIPTGSLYEDALLNIKQHTDTLKIHHDVIPLHKNMIISYDMNSKKGDDMSKYYLARITSWGAAYHVRSKLKGNTLTAYTRTLGTYSVRKDTEAPTIKTINFKDGQWISKNKTLKLSIDDKDSGIDGYRATVNGKFILMEYDYKTNSLTHDFADGVVTDSNNELKVIVTDNVGNSTKFEATFNRKS